MAMQHGDFLLYLDLLPDPTEGSSSSHCSWAKETQSGGPREVMIFLKHFDATKQTLFGIGKVCVPRVMKVSELAEIINERMKWRSGTQLKLYEVSRVAHFHQYNLLICYRFPGTQTRHDRAHETN